MKGVFTISLDYELHWGVFDKRDRSARKKIYENTLALVPKMLEMFQQYEVHVTWATVGSMFARDQQEWKQLKPAVEPDYLVEEYSAYKYAAKQGLPEACSWAHFAPESVRSILDFEGQELGTHTFSHYYCLEKQTNANAFVEDLKAAANAGAKFNNKPVSLVFPRNQFNPGYLKACFENGIQVVRSNPDSWYWTPVQDTRSKLVRKFFRTSDAYIQLGGNRTSYPLQSIKVIPGEPLQLPASRFLRPWRSKYKFANTLRLNRVMQEIKTAAIKKECYHLWWHPENFGDHPAENLETLHALVRHYKMCKDKYGMESWNMGEYVHKLGIG